MIEQLEYWRTRDSEGRLMPWYTRKCCEWLDTIDLKGKNVFEYGCGMSTLWYKAKGANVYGVDKSKEWIERAGKGIGYEKHELGYISHIHKYHLQFDFIAIDGDFRDQCMVHALYRLNENGYIIIDNWKQPTADLEHWPITEDIIESHNLKMTIYDEPTHEDWKTLVLSR